MLTGVATDQSFDAHEDPRSPRLILERVDPLGELVSLFYSHTALYPMGYISQ